MTKGKILDWFWFESSLWLISVARQDYKKPTFTGKEQDDPTGLYYFNARYYDPNLGRFISEDPARVGTNWYMYCGNSPISYFDPDGEERAPHTVLGGVMAHQVIEMHFIYSDLPGRKEAEFAFTPFRADLFYQYNGITKLGEIKPDSWYYNPAKRKKGYKQLDRYIFLNRIFAVEETGYLIEYNPPAVLSIPGTEWFVYLFKYDDAPGMYYYYLDNGRKDGKEVSYQDVLEAHTSYYAWKASHRLADVNTYLDQVFANYDGDRVGFVVPVVNSYIITPF